jgi:hypothetical protein
MRKSLWQKQIPTILGVGVLVVALVIGTVAFTMQGGPSVFAPRASSEETPKKIKLTNVADTSFTVSFFTDGKTAGFVKYGTEEKSLKSQASDDRDQLTGNISSYNLHHITIRGLQPATTYYYVLGTGSNKEIFDNNGAAFKITTAKKTGSPPAAKTAYGTVLEASGGPAEGAVVYLSTDGAGEMSSLVKNSGSWAIPLSTARVPDGSSYAKLMDDQNVNITVQGTSVNNISTISTTIGKSQPVAAINLTGSSQVAVASPTTAAINPDTEASASAEETVPEASPEILTPPVSSSSAGLGGLANLTSSSTSAVATAAASSVVDLTKKDSKPIVVTTEQPIIKGTAPANIEVTIEVHSDNNISQTVTTDDSGAYALDIAKLSENLEPGEHTVTIKYTDPATGKLVTTTKTFNVAPQSTSATKTSTSTSTTSKLALATSPSPSPSPRVSPVPYGTGNPYSTATTSTKVSTSSSRVSYPSTRSGIPTSGSVGTTFTLIIGGLFFIIAGLWSFWIANQLQEEKEIIA